MREVFEQIDINPEQCLIGEDPVLIGGPVQQEHGFVLHQRERRQWNSSFVINDQLALTTSKDILEAIAIDQGPKRILFALGYAGWGPGQLEQEMLENSWLTTPATHSVLFDHPIENRWREAAQLIGVDLANLSNQTGHA